MKKGKIEELCREFVDGQSLSGRTLADGKEDGVIERIHELQSETARAQCVDRDWLLLRGLDVFRIAMEPKPEKRWDASAKAYVESGGVTYDLQGALKALKFLSELTGGGGDAGENVAFIDDTDGDGE